MIRTASAKYHKCSSGHLACWFWALTPQPRNYRPEARSYSKNGRQPFRRYSGGRGYLATRLIWRACFNPFGSNVPARVSQRQRSRTAPEFFTENNIRECLQTVEARHFCHSEHREESMPSQVASRSMSWIFHFVQNDKLGFKTLPDGRFQPSTKCGFVCEDEIARSREWDGHRHP